MKYTTSETLRPPPHWYGDLYERSLDPWHRDAFPPGLEHVAPVQTNPRTSGWMALDWCGNALDFFPDGSEVEATPQQIREMKPDMRDTLMQMGAEVMESAYRIAAAKEQP